MKKVYFFIIFSLSLSLSFAKLDLKNVVQAASQQTSSSKGTSSKSNNSIASSLSGATSIDKALNNSLQSVQNEIISKLDKEISKFEKLVNENINKVTSKFDKEINSVTSRVTGIVDKVETIANDVEKQYKNIISMKDSAIASVLKIVHNLPRYLFYVKLVVFAIIGLFVLLVLFFWRTYSRTKKFANSLANFQLTEDIKRIEAKLDEILSKLNK